MQGLALMLTSLTAYYDKNAAHRRLLRDMVEGSSPISLRLMDWFVTHYARHRNIVYWIDDANKTMHEAFPVGRKEAVHLRKFSVYLEYRAQLKSYSKHVFDPFRRHERLTFVVQPQPLQTVDSTVGQLNFFRWALQNCLVDYIQRHLAEIEDEMTRFAHERRATVLANPAPPPTHVAARPAAKATGKQGIGVVHGSHRIAFD